MNIKEAKQEIKNTVSLYLEKDRNGQYIIPVVRQRPVFLVGAPGIGKTAIMEQIAAEMDIALVSYSMTHHTRQSAIGLPYLAEKQCDGRNCTVSEYTMSEIIASIYDVMEKSGKREGILFLDEINCVSETLAPSMLLFLQYKRFGNERIPEGWVVVTAGNPPQFNKSVKEFDIATLDRLKYMQVEESYAVWKEYASSAGLHPAILAFLELNTDCFYKITTSVDGKFYITARGWEDLSSALRGYERKGFEVTSSLVMQYITITDAARKFTSFYHLFQKYRSNYGIANILDGTADKSIEAKAKKAAFDERLSVISLLRDLLCERLRAVVLEEESLQTVVKILRRIKKTATDDTLEQQILAAKDELLDEWGRHYAAGNLDPFRKAVYSDAVSLLTTYATLAGKTEKNRFKAVQTNFAKRAKEHEALIASDGKCIANAFAFIRNSWNESQEMSLFVTELTMNAFATGYISRWGSPDYYKYNKDLLVYDQEENRKSEIDALLK